MTSEQVEKWFLILNDQFEDPLYWKYVHNTKMIQITRDLIHIQAYDELSLKYLEQNNYVNRFRKSANKLYGIKHHFILDRKTFV